MRKATLNKCLCERAAALRGARFLAYLKDMSFSLRAVRLASHLAHQFLQRLQKLAICCFLQQQMKAVAS